VQNKAKRLKIKGVYKMKLFKSAFSLLLLAGCVQNLPSIGPDYKEEELIIPDSILPDAGFPTTNLTATFEYKSAVSNSDDRIIISNNSLAKWWTRFDDPILQTLVEGSVTNNLNFLSAQRRLERAYWELVGTYSAFLPGVYVDGKAVKNITRKNNKYLRTDNFNLGINSTWEIDIFGGSRRATESALATAEAEGWTVADAWIALTTSIGREYINLRTIQSRIAVARTNLVLQSETYDILKSRLDSGIGDELAVNQCAYIVEQTRARIPDLLTAEESLKNSLAILAGQFPGSLHDALSPLADDRDWLLCPQKVSQLPLDMIRARPDVKAQERKLAAQVAAVGVAKSLWFPKFYINGGVGMESSKFSKIFSKDSFYASIGPSVSWPLFQGGNIYASVKKAEALVEEARLNYEHSVHNAYGEVRNAYSAYTQEYHRYQALKSAVKAATDAVTISNDLYKNGLKDFNNVLDAQRSRLQLEEELVISRGQITLNLIELYKSLGGGLSAEQ
jgi:NodT family efflux transporter outer membrane factor (OMF) lipoprotein